MPHPNETDLSFSEICRHFIEAFTYLERSVGDVDRHQSGSVTWLHWPANGRRNGRYFYEFFGIEGDPEEMISVVGQVDPQQPYFISDMYSLRASAADAYRHLGYTTNFQEPIMVLKLAELEGELATEPVCDVTTMDQATAIQQAFARADERPRPTSQKQIDDAQTIIKAILIDGEPAATGKGILLNDLLYVTDIGTIPSFRKRGFGAAIMRALHLTAKKRGATYSILSATQMAAALYRSLGYRDVGVLDIYEPLPEA